VHRRGPLFRTHFLGLALGMVFSLMTASMSYEDPLLRQNAGTSQRARDILRETGKSMWSSGKGFGKVGAIYASIECVIESVRSCLFLKKVLVTHLARPVSRQNRPLQLGWSGLPYWRCACTSLRPKNCLWRRHFICCVFSCNRYVHETGAARVRSADLHSLSITNSESARTETLPIYTRPSPPQLYIIY
jgi:hypothetical protein